MQSNQDTIQRYVSDMVSVARHVYEAVDRQKSDQKVVRMTEAHDLLLRISQVLDQQIAVLRRHLVNLEGAASDTSMGTMVEETSTMIKETVATTLGQAAGVIGMGRPDKVSLMLRDDYTAMNMLAIAYTMLHATGLALKDPQTAEICQQQLGEITPLIIEINEVMPRIVIQELVDEAAQVDMTVIPEAIQNTQRAWDHQHVHSGHTHAWESSGADSMEDTSPSI